jgi:hypothetical protein
MMQGGPEMSGGPMYTTGKPHRGTLVLVLGILAIVFNICLVPGVLAWTFGNQDLKEMDAGMMDPSGRGMTQAGKIMGIVGTVLVLIIAVVQLLIFLGLMARPH